MATVGADDVAEGDRLFARHGEWMKGHPREGDVALLSYTISKGPELSNPMDMVKVAIRAPGAKRGTRKTDVLEFRTFTGCSRRWPASCAAVASRTW